MNVYIECVLLGAWICIKETLSWSIPCGEQAGGDNNETTTACDTSVPNLPTLPDERGPKDDNGINTTFAPNTIYTGLIFLGVVAIPLAVCLRICWIKSLRSRQERTITELRRDNSPVVDDYPADIYTITFDGVPIDGVYGPPPYYDNTALDDIGPPPPYDQPPPYKKDIDTADSCDKP